MAILVLAQIPLGIYASRLPIGLERLQWLSRHKTIGITLLVLVLARLLWRLAVPPPALPGSMPRWEQRAATITHRMLYALLLAAPIAGWLYASAAGLSVSWFGLVHVPDLIAKDRALADAFKLTHTVLVSLLAVLIAGHVAAALRHALLRHDGVMQRMLPWQRRDTGVD